MGHNLRKTRTVISIALFTFLGALIFSSSAYAEVTTLTVSNSGETISFDKIKPSGSGTVTKATDSLSVNTNCTEGIDLYMSAQNGSSHGTSLVNNTANSNNEITTLSGTTIGDSSTAKALSSNTWGFNTVDNNTYYGLPTYANALSHAVYSGTDSSIPIYYGAKVTSSMATGKYNGSVLYTVLVNMNCNNYTVEYDINTPEGAEGSIVSSTPPDDTILTYAKKSKLAENTFEITGYNFLGWSLDPNYSPSSPAPGSTLYDANSTEYYGSDIALAASADPGSTITMYAVWEEIPTYMQDWLGCASMAIGDTVTLTDSRDNSKYTVKKFGSGSDAECWMTSNLKLGYDKGYTLTSTDTNIPDSTTYYLPRAGYMGPITSSSTITSTTTASFDSSSSSQACVQYRAEGQGGDSDSPGTLAQNTGYYNYPAASLGYSYNNGGASSGDTPRDICPKGWQLPRGPKASTSFYWLDTVAFGGTGSGRTDTTARNKYLNQASFGYSGFYSSSTLSSVGSSGYWWSSTVYNTYDAYTLILGSNGYVGPTGNSSKYNGFPVRCVDQNSNVSGYMQDFDANTELPNTTDSTYLVDKRDGKKYAVKRLPDGKVWMMQNLTVNGVELTPEDTNIADGNTYYLPKDGGAGSITDLNTKNATTGYNFTYDSGAQAMFKFRPKSDSYTNDSDTGYYNFYAATLGYSYYGDSKTSGTSPQDICPKGWRMPRTTDSGSNITAIDTTNDFTYLARTYSTSNWKNNTNSYAYYSTNSALMNSMYKSTATTADNYAGFSYAGYWDGTNSSVTNTNSTGHYWTASICSPGYGYYLYFTSSRVYPQNYGEIHGYPVRCIAKSSYTINYNANGGVGEMASSKGYIGGSALSKNTFTREGYYFLGWSTDQNATSPTYYDGATISTDPTSAGGSVTLYAVWGLNSGTMQNFNCNDLSINDTAYLMDSRDSSVYSVKKFGSGSDTECWMTSDLKLGYDKSYTLTKSDTNIPDDTIYYLPSAGHRGSVTDQNTLSSTNAAAFTSSNSSQANVQYASSGTIDSSTGNSITKDTGYYNFNAASLGFINNSSYSIDTPRDICPKGWQLPRGHDTSTYSFYWLDRVFGGTGSNKEDATVRDRYLSQASFTYSGSYSNSILSDVGRSGAWWASTASGESNAYVLTLGNSDNYVWPQATTAIYSGRNVRCVAK